MMSLVGEGDVRLQNQEGLTVLLRVSVMEDFALLVVSCMAPSVCSALFIYLINIFANPPP
eukprot:c13767_g1_i1 orf=80-259(+)